LGNVLWLLLASGIFIALVIMSFLFAATFSVFRYVAAIWIIVIAIYEIMKYFLATQLGSIEHVLNRSGANRFISAHDLTVWTVEPQETTMNVIRMLTAVGSYDKLESCSLY